MLTSRSLEHIHLYNCNFICTEKQIPISPFSHPLATTIQFLLLRFCGLAELCWEVLLLYMVLAGVTHVSTFNWEFSWGRKFKVDSLMCLVLRCLEWLASGEASVSRWSLNISSHSCWVLREWKWKLSGLFRPSLQRLYDIILTLDVESKVQFSRVASEVTQEKGKGLVEGLKDLPALRGFVPTESHDIFARESVSPSLRKSK